MAGGAVAAELPACVARNPRVRPIEYPSVEILPDRRITFRLCAPQASGAKVLSSEIEGIATGYDGKPYGLPMAKDARDYWVATTPTAVKPGPYRYAFEVDGARLPDPQGTDFSEEYRGVVSVLEVPGVAGDFAAFHREVPHGLVSVVRYWSTTLGAERRAHVYTPPGYAADGGRRRYPVLYLVHGAGDSDDSWTSIGHAHLILDNLIAAGKAVPMIVVMPFGHTPDRPDVARMNNRIFAQDLTTDLLPLIDRNFRTDPVPARRAMAGLSMGGAHTLQFGLTRPDLFGPIGIFSMGFYAEEQVPLFLAEHGSTLPARARSRAPVFFAMGREDMFYKAVAPTRKVLDDAGIRYDYHESDGGHTWANWRDYLALFLLKLFRP